MPTAETLRLHHLTYLDDDEAVVVGRMDTGVSAEFPPDGAELIKRIGDGLSPSEAADWYETTYEEAVDVDDFVALLYELDFVDDGSSPISPDAARAAAGRPLRWQRLGAAAFSPVGLLAAMAVVATAVVAMVRDHSLFPGSSDVLFTSSFLVVQATIIGGQVLLAGVHECGHVLAGRRLGVPARFRASNRLYFVVFETVLDGLALVPRRKRYLPLLAGMIVDLVGMSIMILLAAQFRGSAADPSLFSRICLAMVVATFLRVLWQFNFFLRTDVYFLITTRLRCDYLQELAKARVSSLYNKARGRHHKVIDESGWEERERRLTHLYTPVFVLGYVWVMANLALVGIPLVWTVAQESWNRLADGPTHANFFDTVGFLALNVGEIVLAWFLARRDKAALAANSVDPSLDLVPAGVDA